MLKVTLLAVQRVWYRLNRWLAPRPGVRQAQGLVKALSPWALVSGLTLHAAVRCDADDHQALAQLCGCITHPAQATQVCAV